MKTIRAVFGMVVLLASYTYASAQLTDTLTDEVGESMCLSLTYNMKLGSRDARTNGEVSDLQAFLQEGGYLASDPTGYFGAVTMRAVQAFQRAESISATGQVGPLTRTRISGITCAQGEATSPPRVPTPPVPPTRPSPSTDPSVSLLSTPTLRLSYDSVNKESLLRGTFMVRVVAGATEMRITKPNYSISGNSYYFSLILNPYINYYGTPTVIASGLVTDYGSYYVVPANGVAAFTITADFTPRRMFAGAYNVQLKWGYNQETGMTTTELGQTPTVTVVGESAFPQLPSEPSVSLTGDPKLVLAYDSTNKESLLRGKFVVKVTAGREEMRVARPGYSVPANTYFFSPQLDPSINYSGAHTVSGSGQVTDYGNYLVVPAGGSAVFEVTADYTPRRMFAGAYSVKLGLYQYRDTGTTILELGRTQAVTVVGENAVPQTQAGITVIGSPKLELEYENGKGEASLVATYNLRITAPPHSSIYPTLPVALHKGTEQSVELVNTNLTTVVTSGPTAVAAGTTADVTVQARVDPKKLFAGSYEMVLAFKELLVTGAISTNRVTIVGEVSPYISSSSYENGEIVLRGARFGLPGQSGVMIDGVQPFPVIGGDSTTIRVSAPSLAPGGHSVFVVNPITGNSNSTYVITTVPPSITAVPQVYFNDRLDGYAPAAMTRDEAVTFCTNYSVYNRTVNMRCVWNGETIYSHTAGSVLGASTSRSCVDLRNKMFLGVRDVFVENEVSELQSFLAKNGYLSGEMTGYFGVQTEDALKRYQKEKNLIVTGIAGKVTRDTIKASTCN